MKKLRKKEKKLVGTLQAYQCPCTDICNSYACTVPHAISSYDYKMIQNTNVYQGRAM